MTHEQTAEILGVTRARLSQYESGDQIPLERIQEWCNSPKLPAWAHVMAYQMWLAALELQLEQQQTAFGEQFKDLSRIFMAWCAGTGTSAAVPTASRKTGGR